MAVILTINDVKDISKMLSDRFNIDYSNYTFSFLRRRLNYLLDTLNFKKLNDFKVAIEHGGLDENFNYYFPVETTELFRDPAFWRSLKTKLLPNLNDEELIFWLPNVSTAEELFSLLVILAEDDLLEKSEVYCNVVSKKRINEILSGIVLNKNIEINNKNYKRLESNTDIEKYFTQIDGKIYLNKELLRPIKIIESSFFHCNMNTKAKVTIFRNNMIYYNSFLQVKVEEILLKNIEKNGYLALGIKERISKENEIHFSLFDNHESIYKVV